VCVCVCVFVCACLWVRVCRVVISPGERLKEQDDTVAAALGYLVFVVLRISEYLGIVLPHHMEFRGSCYVLHKTNTKIEKLVLSVKHGLPDMDKSEKIGQKALQILDKNILHLCTYSGYLQPLPSMSLLPNMLIALQAITINLRERTRSKPSMPPTPMPVQNRQNATIPSTLAQPSSLVSPTSNAEHALPASVQTSNALNYGSRQGCGRPLHGRNFVGGGGGSNAAYMVNAPVATNTRSIYADSMNGDVPNTHSADNNASTRTAWAPTGSISQQPSSLEQHQPQYHQPSQKQHLHQQHSHPHTYFAQQQQPRHNQRTQHSQQHHFHPPAGPGWHQHAQQPQQPPLPGAGQNFGSNSQIQATQRQLAYYQNQPQKTQQPHHLLFQQQPQHQQHMQQPQYRQQHQQHAHQQQYHQQQQQLSQSEISQQYIQPGPAVVPFEPVVSDDWVSVESSVVPSPSKARHWR